MNHTAIFTSCAANYIPKARVLGESVKRFHSDVDVYLLLVDDIPPHFTLKDTSPTAQGAARSGGGSAAMGGQAPHQENTEPFDAVVKASELNIPNFEQWIFGHKIVEACTAVKPFMLKHLLEKGYQQVMYFDPDIALFFPLTEMLAEFDHASILLTPHQCKPEQTDEAIKDNEICSLKHGLFNFGYVGVQNDDEGRRYAGWWADRCYYACFEDTAGGVFTDQKWNDFVPIFFDRVKILKSPVYNVATWNYTQRDIQGTLEDGFTVDGQPLVFHHFTGYDSGAHHIMLEKYGNHMPATQRLSQWYEDSCQAFAQADLAAVKWKYGSYSNGETITPAHRKLYRSRKDLQEAFPQPFSAAPQGKFSRSYVDWLKSEGYWNAPTYDTSRPPRPFREFLAEMEGELRGYIDRTHKLKPWMKRLMGKCLSMKFKIARCILR